jgi:hypothetical protein
MPTLIDLATRRENGALSEPTFGTGVRVAAAERLLQPCARGEECEWHYSPVADGGRRAA